MATPNYGSLEYERARAITLVEDIEGAQGLMQGGEQYPNGLCAEDAARMLRHALTKEPDLPTEEREAVLALASGLELASSRGVDIEGVNGEPGGMPYEELRRLAEDAMRTGIPAWTP